MDCKTKGIELAWLLRHDKQAFNDGLIDSHGWRDCQELINNHGFTMETIENIVKTNNKKRFEFNDDQTKIRARQGHSINVDVELKEETPPKILYHGTSLERVESILKNGINNGGRLHVHLTESFATALKSGQRHGVPMVVEVNALDANNDGVKFLHSANDVWLTEFVDPKYINRITNKLDRI